jgi:OOP family OmpA-OmpF porin
MNRPFSSVCRAALGTVLVFTVTIAATAQDTAAPSRRLPAASSIVNVPPPQVAEYWMTATRQAGGVIVFDGYVPDDATRQLLAQSPGADVAWLQLGSGAPAQFGAAVDFGLSLLQQLSEGRFSLRAGVLTITGTAASSEAYQALSDALATQAAPDGFVLAAAEIAPPRVETYVFAAEKRSNGSVVVSGMVPNPQSADALAVRAGQGAAIDVTYASGAPTNFDTSAASAIDLLLRLESGQVRFDGSMWTLTGTPRSEAERAALEQDFLARRLASAGWSMALSQPSMAAAAEPVAAPVAEPAPVAEAVAAEPPQVEPLAAPPEAVPGQETQAAPEALITAPSEPIADEVAAEEAATPVDPAYAFSATNANGAIILSGQAPSEAVLQALVTASAGDAAAVTVTAGAPAAFGEDAIVALRALNRLVNGQLSFANGAWTLAGTATDEASRDRIVSELEAERPGLVQADIFVEAVAAAAPPVAAPAQGAPADISACSAAVDGFSARNAILFRSGAAIIAPASETAIDELAGYLAGCPDAVVHVEGHTDADGEERLNLALSVARAEAVVAALAARGIEPARLYAIGYGEAAPVADNDTAEGKQLNRRIVVKVLAQHF